MFKRTSAKRRRQYKKSYTKTTRPTLALGVENKFIDYSYASTAIVATNTGAEADPATALSLSVMAIGDGESDRDGRKAIITSLHVKGDVTMGSTEASVLTTPCIVRVALVLDSQSNGAQLNSEDVFLPATNVEHAFRNLQYTKRFKVLRDELFYLNPQAGAGDGTTNDTAGVSMPINWNVNLKTPVQFSNSSAVIANVVDNSYHVIAFASAASTAFLKYESRCRFVG